MNKGGRINSTCRNILFSARPLPHGSYKKSYLYEKVINTYYRAKGLFTDAIGKCA